MPSSPSFFEDSSPYDGIIYDFEEGSRSPYLGRYYIQKTYASGKPKSVPVRKRFKTSEERDIWAKESARTLASYGRKTSALDPARANRWALADQLLLAHEDPLEVANFYRKHHPSSDPTVGNRSLRCSAVLAKYIDHKREDPAFEYGQYRRIYQRFNSKWGAMRVEHFERSIHDFEDWIAALPFKPVTKSNHFSRVRAAFRWAYKRDLIQKNPFDRATAPKRVAQDIQIATPEELLELFIANFDRPGTCAKIALSCQGGMRTEAVARLEYRDLRFDENAIETPAWKTKKERRQLIQGLPDCVWPWLKRASEEDFAKPCAKWRSLEHRVDWKKRRKTQWMHEKERAIKRAELILPPNWARKTFITCHATHFENLPLTAELVSHEETVKTIKQNYLGVILKRDAGRLFEWTPEIVEREIRLRAKS